MRPGDIYLAQFPFGDAPGMKLRPVLLLPGALGLAPEVLVAYISSVIPSQLLPSDMLLDPGNVRIPVHSSQNLVGSALAQIGNHSLLKPGAVSRSSGCSRAEYDGEQTEKSADVIVPAREGQVQNRRDTRLGLGTGRASMRSIG
jgi:hypothetical protein